MSLVKVMNSGDVRNNWRDVLDTVFSNEASVVVERHGKPLVIIVNYKQWKEDHYTGKEEIEGA